MCLHNTELYRTDTHGELFQDLLRIFKQHCDYRVPDFKEHELIKGPCKVYFGGQLIGTTT